MNATSTRALLALGPVLILFSGTVALYARTKTRSSLLQMMIGAACLIFVLLTHIREALNLFPWMRWGAEDKHWSLR